MTEEWSTAKTKKKGKKKYTPPDWSRSIQTTVDSMTGSDFFAKVTEQLDKQIKNHRLVILGLGQGFWLC